MSWLHYFASDTVLEERKNPYIEKLSVNQALKKGIDVKLDWFADGFDRDKPDVILYCAEEDKLEYPNIYAFSKDEYYDDIGTEKQFCTALEWSCSEENIKVVLEYIRSQMEVAEEIEIWSVWLGNDAIKERVKKHRYRISELTIERLKCFYKSKVDYKCIVVSR